MQVLEKLEEKCADYDCVYVAITIQEKHWVKLSLVCSWLEHQRTQVTKVEACRLVSENQSFTETSADAAATDLSEQLQEQHVPLPAEPPHGLLL